MTLGEYRVEINFNPSDSSLVAEIKYQAGKFLDLVDGIAVDDAADDSFFGEVYRLKQLAMAHIEDAAMWAVKAATKQPMEPTERA